MKTGFLLFVYFYLFIFFCRPSTSFPVVYKYQERLEPYIMSESDTMFNERDRICTAVQLMLSTDPSYDNKTIASTFKMQIRTVQRLRAQLNASGELLVVNTNLKVNTKVYLDVLKSVVIPWCNQVAGGRP